MHFIPGNDVVRGIILDPDTISVIGGGVVLQDRIIYFRKEDAGITIVAASIVFQSIVHCVPEIDTVQSVRIACITDKGIVSAKMIMRIVMNRLILKVLTRNIA